MVLCNVILAAWNLKEVLIQEGYTLMESSGLVGSWEGLLFVVADFSTSHLQRLEFSAQVVETSATTNSSPCQDSAQQNRLHQGKSKLKSKEIPRIYCWRL